MPSGTVLKRYDGDLTVTTPGTVIDSQDIRGFVTIKAMNVMIKNSIIRGGSATHGRGMINVTSAGSLTMQDSEISPTMASPYLNGVLGSNFILRRVDINNVVDSVRIQGNNVIVEKSWLHDNAHFQSDPTQGGAPSHDDSIQIEKGSNITISGSTITGAVNVGILVGQNLGTTSQIKVADNYLDGGGCTLNFSEMGRGPIQDAKVSGNRFGRTTKVANCPIISPTTTTAQLNADANVYDNDNSPAPIRRG